MTDIAPHFVSVDYAAHYLGGISKAAVYAKLDRQEIESRYEGRRRLVVLASLRDYAESLPSVRPEVAS